MQVAIRAASLRVFMLASIYTHHSPDPTATTTFQPRTYPRPVRRQAPTESPLSKSLDLVARSGGYVYDVLRGLNERDIERSGGHRGAESLGVGAFELGGRGVCRLG